MHWVKSIFNSFKEAWKTEVTMSLVILQTRKADTQNVFFVPSLRVQVGISTSFLYRMSSESSGQDQVLE